MKRTVIKIVALVFSLSVLLSSCVTFASDSEFETAKEAVEKIKVGWNLGNTLDSTGDWIGKYSDGKPVRYETAWGNPVTTPELITAVKNAGFNAIRVPVTWQDHIDENGVINEEWMTRVNEVVDYVISQDLYCIINVHHDAGSDGWLEASENCYNESSDKFKLIWEQISNRFMQYGEKLMFESFNEILDVNNNWSNAKASDAYEATNKFNQLFVDTVRKSGGNNVMRNLMVQVYSASTTKLALDNFVLPEDTVESHLIIQVHNYDPQGFTYPDATWTTMTDKWGTDEEKQAFDKLFEKLGKYSEQFGVPIVVGEFGAEDKDNEAPRIEYANYFVTTAAKYGIKCFWWDTAGMALFDRTNISEKFPNIIDALTEPFAETDTDTDKALKGDINSDGALDIIDVVICRSLVVGSSPITDEQIEIVDMNGDSLLDIVDIAMMRRIIVG